ncbi:TPA: immunoglobulin domain-containing protein [Enterobacter cloacae]
MNEMFDLTRGIFDLLAKPGGGGAPGVQWVQKPAAGVSLNGKVTASWSGGTAPYTVTVTNGSATVPHTTVSATSIEYTASTAGAYKITITDANGKKKVATVNVYRDPVITQITHSPINLNEKDELQLTVTATDAISFEWFKEGSAASLGKGSTLTIKDVKQNDSGRYYAVATGNLGTAAATSSKVNVSVVPYNPNRSVSAADITLSFAGITGKGTATATGPTWATVTLDTAAGLANGGSVKATIKSNDPAETINGKPSDVFTYPVAGLTPLLEWDSQHLAEVGVGYVLSPRWKGGKAPYAVTVLNGGNTITSANGAQLTITIQTPNVGDYDMTVTDALGQTITRTVKANPHPVIKTFTVTPQTAIVGDEIKMVVTAENVTNYSWQKDKQDATGSNIAVTISADKKTSTLTIKKAALADKGEYTVTALGAPGTTADLSTSLLVGVELPGVDPSFATAEPVFSGVHESGTATMPVIGNVTPTFSKDKNLRNGEVIKVTLTADTGYTINGVDHIDQTFTVKGLTAKDLTVADTDVTPLIEGVSTLATAKADNVPANTKLSISPVSGLANGDTVTVTVVADVNYTVNGSHTVSFDFPVQNLRPPVSATPVFSPDLANVSFYVGDGASMKFDASPMTSFEWQEKDASGNWAAIPNATGKTWAPTAAMTAGQVRTIRVVATNDEGGGKSVTTANSTEAKLTCMALPTDGVLPGGIDWVLAQDVNVDPSRLFRIFGSKPVIYTIDPVSPNAKYEKGVVTGLLVGDVTVKASMAGGTPDEATAIIHIAARPTTPVTVGIGDMVGFKAGDAFKHEDIILYYGGYSSGNNIMGSFANWVVSPAGAIVGDVKADAFSLASDQPGGDVKITKWAAGGSNQSGEIIFRNVPRHMISALPVVTNPAALGLPVNHAARFSVTSSITGANVTYQWQVAKKATPTVWNNVAGGTAATLTIANAPLSSDGDFYRCVVTNAEPNKSPQVVTTASAKLTVWPELKITAEPVAVEVYEGDPARFAVTVTGAAPLTYSWKLATSSMGVGKVIGTTSTLSLTTDHSYDAKAYVWCDIQDAHGQAVQTNKVEFTVHKITRVTFGRPNLTPPVSPGNFSETGAIGLKLGAKVEFVNMSITYDDGKVILPPAVYSMVNWSHVANANGRVVGTLDTTKGVYTVPSNMENGSKVDIVPKSVLNTDPNRSAMTKRFNMQVFTA